MSHALAMLMESFQLHIEQWIRDKLCDIPIKQKYKHWIYFVQILHVNTLLHIMVRTVYNMRSTVAFYCSQSQREAPLPHQFSLNFCLSFTFFLEAKFKSQEWKLKENSNFNWQLQIQISMYHAISKMTQIYIYIGFGKISSQKIKKRLVYYVADIKRKQAIQQIVSKYKQYILHVS